MDKPSFYTVIPAFVRYNPGLTDFDKLMYGEIAALTNANNYCWATNRYFCKVFGKAERTVKYSIQRLVRAEVISSTISAENGNQRILRLNTPRAKNGTTPHAKNGTTPPKPYYKNNTRVNNFKYSHKTDAKPIDTNVAWFNDYLNEQDKDHR